MLFIRRRVLARKRIDTGMQYTFRLEHSQPKLFECRFTGNENGDADKWVRVVESERLRNCQTLNRWPWAETSGTRSKVGRPEELAAGIYALRSYRPPNPRLVKMTAPAALRALRGTHAIVTALACAVSTCALEPEGARGQTDSDVD
ncbi:hypothetical protein NMY22_g4474 [Coprinellus aureogranulatus]|nr:hypothetical protein NMY22_g4474 [Coprinellus aureogranulatus]